MENCLVLKVNEFIELTLKDLEKFPKITQTIFDENIFPNPLYVSNQKNGRSNRGVDKEIKTVKYDRFNDKLIICRGYGARLRQLFRDAKLQHDLIDERTVNPIEEFPELEGVTLRDYQEACVIESQRCDQGMFIAPTGSGKSIIGLEIIRRAKQKALIIVHRNELAKQWQDVIYELMELDAPIIGNGKFVIGEKITIAMIQTLNAREDETDFLARQIGLVLVDEAHHVPANTFKDVLNRFGAKKRYGLSATPQRADGLSELIYRVIGVPLYEVERERVLEVGGIIQPKVYVKKTFCNCEEAYSWNNYLDYICDNKTRNTEICRIAHNQNKPTLILTDRVEHAKLIYKILEPLKDKKTILIHGKSKNRDELMKQIEEADITVATTGLMGEGIDVKRWEVLVLATPISSHIKLCQAIGRVIRPCLGKEAAIIYDFIDNCGFSVSSFKKREKIYISQGIVRQHIN